MSTPKPAPPPQSVALVWTVLAHVLVLPVAASYLPALLPRAGLAGAPDTSGVAPFLLSGLFAALILMLHAVLWRMARAEGRIRLARVVAALGLVSLATLALLGTPAPLLVLARLVGVVL